MLKTEKYNLEKFHSLDFIRGMAALTVAMAHFGILGGYVMPEMAAGICVAYFFVLSGFVLSYAYEEHIISEQHTLKDFFIARIARLYPLHFLTFSLVFLFYIFLTIGRSFGYQFGTDVDFSPLKIFENIFLMNLVFTGENSFNSPAWTIGVEFWCSFFIFHLCFIKNRTVKYSALITILCLYLLVLQQGGFLNGKNQYAFGLLEKNYITGIFLFSLGYITYLAYKYISMFTLPPQIYRPTSWLFLLTLIILVIFPPLSSNKNAWIELPYFLGISVSIFLLTRHQPQNILIQKTMSYFGNISYGIYLWHIPIMLGLGVINKCLKTSFGFEMFPSFIATIIFVGLVIFTASISYKFFELPMKRMLRTFLENFGK